MRAERISSCLLCYQYVCFCVMCRFLMVLICLIFSVLSTIKQYEDIANEILFWMVR